MYIYSLIDPRNHTIRYIGKANNLSKRFNEHWLYGKKDNNKHKKRWLDQLHSLGIMPTLEVLEECDETNWARREQWWIAYGRFLEWPLTNLTDGGEGTVGIIITEETRNKLKEKRRGRKPNLGKKATEETKRKRSESLKGRTLTTEHKSNIQKSMIGKRNALGTTLTEEQREYRKIRNQGKHNKLSVEQVRDIHIELQQGISCEALATKYRVARTTISDIKFRRTWKWLLD